MSPVRPRRIVAASAAATAVLALTGCSTGFNGTGFNAQTNKQYNAGVGTDNRDASIYVLGALFVDNGNKTATFSVSLINQKAPTEKLTSIEATSASGSILSTEFAGPVQLRPDTPYTPGKTGDIVLTGDFTVGTNVTITFTFDQAAPISITAPVVKRIPMYDSVATGAPIPTPEPATETPTAEATATS